jgi:cytochrome c oxidase subunit 2
MEPDPNDVQRPRATVTKGTLVRVILIALVASLLGIAIGLSINWFPIAASKQAGPIDTLWDVLLIFSVPIFVIVCAVILTSIVKFRMRPGEEDLDGPPIHGNTKLEVIWTTIPALLLLGLCTYAYLVLHDIEKAPASGREMRVQVTGQQFDWTFKYELGRKSVTSAQLYLPKGESVMFDVRAVDVLHDFWVPAFRMKIDAVPGIITHYRVTPTRLGSYPIVCAELCGLGHAFMRNTAHVKTRREFATWLATQQRIQGVTGGGGAGAGPGGGGGGGATSPAAQLAAGKAVFTGASGCSGCHTLADAKASGQIGPDLDAGLAHATKAFIKTSIADPNADITKGFGANIMPSNFGSTLSKPQLDAVVNYLYTVTHK